MIEDWIDEVSKVWEISNGRGGVVKSYRLFEKSDLPESLSEYPCAITYPVQARMVYGETAYTIWSGMTEFHLAPGVGKTNMAEMLRYFGRIQAAAAAHVTLGGKVSYFTLDQDQSVQGPVVMDYGDAAPGMGLLVRWMVKTNDAIVVGG